MDDLLALMDGGGVDDELADSHTGEVLEGELDQRPPEHRDQRLGELVGERAQAGP